MSEKKVLLVTYPDKPSIQEAVALVEAAGLKPSAIITRKSLGEGKYGVGAGFASELAKTVKDEGCELVVLDSRLKSVQAYNLAKVLGVRVLDREELILEIFSRRTSTKEAKLQVELAKLGYELPRAKEKVRLAKMGEQPGFYGLGKYQVDVYEQAIRRQVMTLRSKLVEASRRRELHRVQRSRLGLPMVSLAGYTGAGKTALFNYLTGESKEVAKGVFTTLTTYTRALDLSGSKVLLSDTVGFIRRLPSYMIESFKSTLEEMVFSNLTLLVLDVNDSLSEFLDKYWSCVKALSDLHVSPGKVLLVLNKKDLVTDDELQEKVKALGSAAERCTVVSAVKGWGTENLKRWIKQLVVDQTVSEVELAPEDVSRFSDDIKRLRRNASVEVLLRSDGSVSLSIRGPVWAVEKFKNVLKEAVHLG